MTKEVNTTQVFQAVKNQEKEQQDHRILTIDWLLRPTSYPLVLTVWPNQKLLASAEASTRHTDVFITSPPTQHGHLTVQNSLSILFLPSFFSLPISY